MRMKRMILGVYILLSITPQVFAGSVCSHVDLAWISSHAPLSPDAKIVFKQERGELCEVVVSIDGSLAPVYAGKDFIVAGRMFKSKQAVTRETLDSLSDVAEQERLKAKEKERLAAEKRKVFFKNNFRSLAPLVSMNFQPGRPKGLMYVITDPNCTHCKKLLPKLEEVSFEANLALKVIVYPVLGPKSRDMTSHAICNGYSYDQYMEMDGSEGPAACEKADGLIEKTNTLFKSADISFVPLVVAQDGSWVVEGNDICQVRDYLGLESDGEGCGKKKTE